MELIAWYKRKREEDRLLKLAEKKARQPFGGKWEDFQEATGRFITVFAARAAGKTHNLALRAARSGNNCTIFASNQVNLNQLTSMLQDMLADREVTTTRVTRRHTYIELANRRSIYITTDFLARGMRFTNEEVLFDDFDSSRFEQFMNEHIQLLADARHIVAVGSMKTIDYNFAKDWYRDSNTKICIDTEMPNLGSRFSIPRHQYEPSAFMPRVLQPI